MPFQTYLKEASSHPARRSEAIDSRIISRGGTTVYLRSFVAAPLEGDGSRSDMLCGISLDVTKQRRLEQELLQAQKLESIGQLAAGIAHEINTPTQFIGDNIHFVTASVRNVFEVIDAIVTRSRGPEPPVPSDIVELFTDADMSYWRQEMPIALAQTLEGVAHIATIVGAMKDFSHPVIDKTPYDLNRAIGSTITIARNEWKYVADVRTHFDPNLPQVSVMPSAFNQVILNLLVNSAQAIAASKTRPIDEKGLIEISTRALKDAVEIRISDSGCGIPADILHRIFDPFFTTKEVGKGTGQGLALSRDVIVNKHGGTLEVESVANVGTLFVLKLPLDRETQLQVAMA